MSLPKKPRCCRICKEMFQPRKALQNVCSFECEVKLGIIMAERSKKRREQAERVAEVASRKIIRMKLEKLKPLSWYADKAQRAVNAYIRARDAGQPCISCGRHHAGKWNAGHYISRGASPALRYHHDNIWLQCEPCNTNKSGNQIEYRKNLLLKIGQERLDWLEGPHELPRWRKEDYLRIEAEHKQLFKDLNNGN